MSNIYYKKIDYTYHGKIEKEKINSLKYKNIKRIQNQKQSKKVVNSLDLGHINPVIKKIPKNLNNIHTNEVIKKLPKKLNIHIDTNFSSISNSIKEKAKIIANNMNNRPMLTLETSRFKPKNFEYEKKGILVNRKSSAKTSRGFHKSRLKLRIETEDNPSYLLSKIEGKTGRNISQNVSLLTDSKMHTQGNEKKNIIEDDIFILLNKKEKYDKEIQNIPIDEFDDINSIIRKIHFRTINDDIFSSDSELYKIHEKTFSTNFNNFFNFYHNEHSRTKGSTSSAGYTNSGSTKASHKPNFLSQIFE